MSDMSNTKILAIGDKSRIVRALLEYMKEHPEIKINCNDPIDKTYRQRLSLDDCNMVRVEIGGKT